MSTSGEHRAAVGLEVAWQDDRSRAREWMFLALASLFLAGVLATGLVFARMPVFATWVTDPAFFKRCLVVHVDLALVVWFHAFAAGLFALVPSRVRSNPISRHASIFGAVGVVMMLAAAGVHGARPVLANYVPVIDHPLYVGGLVAIGLGLAATFLDPKVLPGTERAVGGLSLPSAAIVGLRACAVAVLLALLTFAATQLVIPAGLAPEAHWEIVMWGGGHVLQFASVAAMLAAWTILLAQVLGRSPIERKHALGLFALLITPLFAAPLLPFTGVTGATYHVTFTRLMQFGIAPAVLGYLAILVRAVLRARRDGELAKGALSSGAFLGFAASAALTLVGFGLGASIRGPNTTIPAHYHASIGAVTVSFMALTVPVLEALGFRSPSRRVAALARLQPMLLGVGQLVFAIGFALAGAHGMRRKAYGGEQVIRTWAEWIGLGVMGVGGLVAVVAGVLFLIVVGAMWRRRLAPTRDQRGDAWLLASTHSNA